MPPRLLSEYDVFDVRAGLHTIRYETSDAPLLFWWMPTGGDPMAAHLNRNGIIVKVQRGDSGSADRCSADDAESVTAPAKMLAPRLRAWIEQRLQRVGHRIRRRRAVALVSVAERATEPQILLVIAASLRSRLDVFNFQWSKDEMLRTEAITTAMPRQFSEATVGISGQAESAYLQSKLVRSPRATAIRNARALRTRPC